MNSQKKSIILKRQFAICALRGLHKFLARRISMIYLTVAICNIQWRTDYQIESNSRLRLAFAPSVIITLLVCSALLGPGQKVMYIMDCVAGGHSLGRALGIRTRTHVNTRRTFLSCNCKKIAKKLQKNISPLPSTAYLY